ncbi:ABC transporter ATP-binding protein [Shinella sp. CPCC 100929]|uniref:ABC transporter ATP-binding protein n=1 Tax=Shinella lacus TaxID=2654216 RepID=A0ABT1RBR8_9HYPH|nr:ABC transporter ATP-binding protein [Shinella lacus]MCQ4632647.1 ABC transporter ATP-binding protein [Shinella lacus]
MSPNTNPATRASSKVVGLQNAPGAEPSIADPIIQLSDVTLQFGEFKALQGVNLAINPGEFFTLLGPSGCGKTSLLRLIAGFQSPTSGNIELDGKDVTAVPPHRRPINTVFQNYALFPHMTVAQNVRFGLEMLGWDGGAADARVPEVLSLVGMNGFATRRPDALSGGQQQRVALARALAPKPRVLLLDEPMSALDLKLRKETQNELKRLHREAGITFILVTHDQEEALTLSDRIAVLRWGEIKQVGSPEEIYCSPANSYVADFIGEANLIRTQLLGVSGDGMVMVRPEDISLANAGESGRISGIVADVRFLGSGIEFVVRTADGELLRARSAGAGRLPEFRSLIGADVRLTWPESAQQTLGG